MPDFLVSIVDFIKATKIPEQVKGIDAPGLFTNPWFMVPFIGAIIYLAFKKSWNNIILLGTGAGVWAFSGSSYMQNVLRDGELQLDSIGPVIGVGLLAVGIIVYVLFLRSD